jgi:hypothetical protein
LNLESNGIDGLLDAGEGLACADTEMIPSCSDVGNNLDNIADFVGAGAKNVNAVFNRLDGCLD